LGSGDECTEKAWGEFGVKKLVAERINITLALYVSLYILQMKNPVNALFTGF
jgi:hypothetical protein